MTSIMLWSVISLCHSLLAENRPREYFEVKGSTFSSFPLKESLSYGEYSSLQSILQSTCHVSACRNRHGQRPGPGLLRLEEGTHFGNAPFFERYKDQLLLPFFRVNDDRHVGDKTVCSDLCTSFLGANGDHVSHVTSKVFVIFSSHVFSLLVVFVVFAFFYVYLFSKRRGLTCSASSSSKRRVVNFQGIRLLMVAIVLEIVFARSAEAVDFTSVSCKECDPGWICFYSSCLKISSEQLTWPQAADECSRHEAHLFSIEKANKLVWHFLYSNYRLKKFLIGLVGTPAPQGGYSYRWSDGSPFVYSDWESLNSHCKRELCAVIVPRWNAARGYHVSWSAVSCLSRNRFICEKPKNCMKTDVQLVGGVTPNRGRLEIFLDGAWNSVCLGKGASRTAASVCKQLGYSSLLFVRAIKRFGEKFRANYSYSVDCSWNNVLNCTYEKTTCDLGLFLSCRSARTFSIEVRLVNSPVPSSGTLEVGIGNTWRKVCGLERNVLSSLPRATCRHLGYDNGNMSFTGLRRGRLRSLHSFCRSNSIGGCSFLGYSSRCFDFIRVDCLNSQLQVRLVNTTRKTTEREGAIEVFFNGNWTAVCEDEWNINASEVVCSELGYKNAVSSRRLSSDLVTSSSQRLAPLKVICQGNETALRQCNHFMSTSRQSCRAARVVCKEKEYCPSGWFLYADYCYTVSRLMFVQRMNMRAGGCGPVNSVTINSLHEQAFVLSLLADIRGDVSIGLKRQAEEVFQWLNGEPLRYVSWANGEPKSFHRCVALDAVSGYWKTADCSQRRQMICKIALVDINTELREAKDSSANGLCREEELYFKNACYYWSKDDELVSQERADENCQNRDAALASISTVHENAFIAKETSVIEGSLYWIGLAYKNTDSVHGAFEWLYGPLVTFTKWAMYEPVFEAESNHSCVLFGSDGRDFVWSVSNCTTKAGYVCKRVVNESNETTSVLPETSSGYVYVCPNGWTKLGNRSCFKRVHAKQTWDDSLIDCEMMGGSLARITSVQEQNLLNSKILNGEEAWIGLNDRFNEGFYVWADGSSLVYVNWSPSEVVKNASLQREHDCVAASTSHWKTKTCTEKKPSVCFRPAILDYDECYSNTSICHVNAACENTLSSYNCTCKPGFTGNGTTCKDLNECDRRCNEKGQRCLNTYGSYECLCESGWTGNGSVCVDVNECHLSDTCHTHATCINKDGSYDCECALGWTGNGSVCIDINECEMKNPCHSKAKCTNTEGTFQCTCQPGWSGNGIYCDDVNECEIENLCDSQATCTNQDGSYSCMCLPGWSGNGFSCNDTNECLLPGLCHRWANCRNTNGSFECLCSSGYKGNGFQCEGITSRSKLKIILPIVISSLILIVFSVIVFVIYARRKALLRGSLLGPDLVEPPDEWEVNAGDMTLLEKLGNGFFGVVHRAYLYHSPSSRSRRRGKAKNSLGDQKSVVACKMLKANVEREDFLEEIRLMKRIGQHPHIVSLLGCITTSEPLCLIVEYCMHGDLLNYLRKKRSQRVSQKQQSNTSCSNPDSLDEDDTLTQCEINEDLCKAKDFGSGECESESSDVGHDLSSSDLLSFVWQISSGMEYLAGKGLVHRDLACRNVLVCENQLLKVSDFGLTRSVYQEGVYCQKNTRRLPLRWMSIEAMTHRLFSEQSDVWSFGVVMWEIYTLGSFPYPCVLSERLLSHLRSGNRLTCPENCSIDMYKIMTACWRSEPEKRPLFGSLTQQVGKMLEAQQQSKYIVFDAWDAESGIETKESEIDDETCPLNYLAHDMNRGKGSEVRYYVAGSATCAV
ncbi:uncharacterized protein [Oscarella lobularis]|uniref:uncharacterized protein isoform X2 n=1 Tax=Oscarella lobularis TaxID=121494 RepID=UPI0033142167